MPRLRKTRKRTRNIRESSPDEDEPEKKQASPIQINDQKGNDSSSESDLDAYLKPADQIDLNSTFFNIHKNTDDQFESIEKKIFSGRNTLSSSDSEDEGSTTQQNDSKIKTDSVMEEPTASTSYSFSQMNNYNKKMEEAMKFVQKYKAKRKEEHTKVEDLLQIGESKENALSSMESLNQLSDYGGSDSDDWEEVENVQENKEVIPRKDVQIIVSMNDAIKKRKNNDPMMMLKRHINRKRKELQVYIHKVNLLCWIAHGNYVNNVLNDETLLALSLSLLPSEQSYPNGRIDLKYLESITKWYKKFINIKKTDVSSDLSLQKLMHLQINKREVWNENYLIYIFVCLIRSLGLSCRLIISLQPEPLRPPNSELFSLSTKPEEKVKTTTKTTVSNNNNIKKEEKKSSTKKKSKLSKGKAATEKKSNDSPSTSQISTPNKPNLTRLSNNQLRERKSVKYTEASSDDDFQLKKPTLSNLRASTRNRKDVKNDIINIVNKSLIEEKYKDESKLTKGKRKSLKTEDVDYVPSRKRASSESEFSDKVKVKRRIPPKSQLIKSTEADKEKKKKIGMNLWVEVFVDDEEKWISVDVIHGQIHCIKELYSRASQPVTYILGWDNDNRVKDITKRYCISWNTVTRKLRVDQLWWDRTLKPFKGKTTARDKEEDDDLARQQLDQPLPKTISEYKDHPLYVLKRHLLKFQAIYPLDAAILGFIRNEPVYSRDCVYTLHSRDIWLKQAKVVKLGEKPYKIVKARPKYDKLSNKIITDQLLEIFGIWQVQDYEPPTAENGIVPKNAYGNVDLFKQCMLPKGTVHIQLPNLNKVARKMNIDCPPAVIGFDFHGGWSHPTFDGFVVCKEHEDVLIAAWYMEQEESEKREREKIEKRVYDNWKRLIRGMLIADRFKNKYNIPTKKVDKDKKKRKNKK